MLKPQKLRKPPSVFYAAMFRGEPARRFEQFYVDSGLRQKQGSGGWAAGNRHQSLSDLLPHQLDLKQLLKVGAAIRAAPVVLRLAHIEGRGTHWELKFANDRALDPLLDAVRTALVQHGFGKGTRNKPHVTLHYRAPSTLEKPMRLPPIEWRIDRVQLVRSTGHGVTYHYEELGSWPLEGEPVPADPQRVLI